MTENKSSRYHVTYREPGNKVGTTIVYVPISRYDHGVSGQRANARRAAAHKLGIPVSRVTSAVHCPQKSI